MSNVSPPILHQGTGMPYLAMFDETGNPIVNQVTGIPFGAYVTSFNYKTEQDKENLATIVIQTGNPNTADDPALQENKTLILQWGYIFADGSTSSSIPIAVRIRDFDLLLNDQGTQITIKCVDDTMRLRQIPVWVPDNVNRDFKGGNTFKDYMDKGFGCNMGIIIERFEYGNN